MTALPIPRTLPAHARTWLAHLDAAVTKRAQARGLTREQEARWQLSHATGSLAYFLHLYLETLEGRT